MNMQKERRLSVDEIAAHMGANPDTANTAVDYSNILDAVFQESSAKLLGKATASFFPQFYAAPAATQARHPW